MGAWKTRILGEVSWGVVHEASEENKDSYQEVRWACLCAILAAFTHVLSSWVWREWISLDRKCQDKLVFRLVLRKKIGITEERNLTALGQKGPKSCQHWLQLVEMHLFEQKHLRTWECVQGWGGLPWSLKAHHCESHRHGQCMEAGTAEVSEVRLRLEHHTVFSREMTSAPFSLVGPRGQGSLCFLICMWD